MSGQSRYRSLWEQYTNRVDAIIFVIDASDSLRFCIVQDELQALLEHDMQASIPLLFFANKMDAIGAASPEELVDILNLPDIQNHPWRIVSSNGITGKGIDIGVDWLCEHVDESKV